MNGPFDDLGPDDMGVVQRLAEDRGWVELKDGDPMEKVFESFDIKWLTWWQVDGKSVPDICNMMESRGLLVMPWCVVFAIEHLSDIMGLTLRADDEGELSTWRNAGL